ncbi:MAG: hypothetical protein ACLQVY_00080 [Limisphaerales bacterium]
MKPLNEVAATFSDLDKAEAVKLKLEKFGIRAKIVDSSRFQKYVLFSRPLACDKVMVEKGKFDQARQLLEAADKQGHLLRDEVRCVQCGSPRVDYPQFARKFITTTFFGVLFSLLRLLDKTFYCQDCHHTWPAAVTLRSRADVLNWPSHSGAVKEERG